jgi:hypothetical protein
MDALFLTELTGFGQEEHEGHEMVAVEDAIF